jgi:hypothetical protein
MEILKEIPDRSTCANALGDVAGRNARAGHRDALL